MMGKHRPEWSVTGEARGAMGSQGKWLTRHGVGEVKVGFSKEVPLKLEPTRKMRRGGPPEEQG